MSTQCNQKGIPDLSGSIWANSDVPEGQPFPVWSGAIWRSDPDAYSPETAPPTIPQVVTIRQAKLALLGAGLLDNIDAIIAGADRGIQIEWEYATTVERTWPTLLALQPMLGLSDEQIDGLFVAAAGL